MKYRKILSLILAVLLITAVFSGCEPIEEPQGSESDSETNDKGVNETGDGESESIIDKPIEKTDPAPDYPPSTDEFKVAQNDFAWALFKESIKQRSDESSMLISPLSVSAALAMTAEGARGETLKDFERIFGMELEKYSAGMEGYLWSLPSSDKTSLNIANSVWFRDTQELTVVQDFLTKCQDRYRAGAFKEPFDASTVEKINKFVDENTDGMIKKLLDSIEDDVMLYLINALVFDGAWADQYLDYQITEDEFTDINGEKSTAQYMLSGEKLYFEDENAKGFIKLYCDGYAFVAILPDEDISVYDYIASADAAGIYSMVQGAQYDHVNVKLPQFKYEYSTEMSEVLKAMGMNRSFLGQYADFSGMATHITDNIAIGRVLHKTAIEVSPYGTKAAAVTAVEMTAESAAMPSEEPKEVYLTRPFIYMIIDTETNLPMFMGTVTEISN